MLILNLMQAEHFTQAGTGATKDWEMSVMFQKHLLQVNIESHMIGYEKGHPGSTDTT